jgi:Ca2+-transporting ATPase
MSTDIDIEQGLTSAEAARLLAEHGPNELRSAPPTPMWRRLLAQLQDPLVYLLFGAVAISLVAWWVEGAHGVPVDVIVIAVIIVLNAGIGLFEELKAADAVAALAQMTAATSTVVRDGQLASIPSSHLVPGDVLALAEGDAVGADARLVTATGLKVQEAALTGESESVVKDPAPVPVDAALGDRTDTVFKGTAIVEGVGRAVVTETGMDTQMGAIAHMLESTEAEPSPLEVELARVSRTLGALVIAIALVVMATMYLVTPDHTSESLVAILLTGVSLAVAAVPEGLVAILSLVLAIGVRAMASRNAVMKDLHSVETLGSTSVICTDKTGTLTRNEMTLREIVTASGRVSVSGTGYVPEGDAVVAPVSLDGTDGDADAALTEARVLLIGGALANNSQLTHEGDDWQIQGDPTEAAFLVARHKVAEVVERAQAYDRRGEVPFTSERKMMSVLTHHDGRDEDRIYSKGAPDVLLGRSTHLRVADTVVPLDETRRSWLHAAIEGLSTEGYRTLGVAYRVLDPDEIDSGVDCEHGLVFIGVVGIMDPPREEAGVAVREARAAGIRPIMITGDHPVTARRIAADLGIVEGDGRALTGAQLDELDEAGFATAVREVNVFARVAPRHKMAIVDALQADGQTVAMTGDGVNDAPALKSADIGIAMGITGTEVTKESARMILGDDNFATIVAAVRQGRVIYANISKFLRYLLSSNLGEVVTVFFGVLLASTGDGRRPRDRRRHGCVTAIPPGPHPRRADVAAHRVGRPRDGRRDPGDL